MRGWLILTGGAVLVVILPLIALTGYFGDLAKLIGQVVLSIVFIIAIIGTGLFGYICIRAQARKWGAGLFIVAILCVLAIYYVWAGHLPFL
ncbi:MAG TPA: hypothetical protein EYP46_02410 [Hadesarchaea archaeon]|nr:hypothetical protein [Hadesarchaea archaeon]